MDRFFTEIRGTGSPEGRMFPAPFEVDRFLYNELYLNIILMKFPAPLEVNRMFYTQPSLQKIKKLSFPAPREVIRVAYLRKT